MDYKVVFDNCKLLFDYFGWFSILLVVATTGLMIPVNILYKKFIKKENLQRLRKLISSLSVYVVALGLVALFTGTVIKAPLTAEYLLGASLSCGLLAMLLWSVIKVVKDYGVAPIIKSIAQSKEAKQALKDLGLDKGLVDTIMNGIDNYLASVNAKTFEDVANEEININRDLRVKLSGFVESENIDKVVEKLLNDIKSKYSNKTE